MTAQPKAMFTLHPQLAKDTLPVGELSICKVLLMNNQRLPWLILVPKRVGMREVYELKEAEQAQLTTESSMLGEMLMKEFSGHKLNVGAIGNLVPQLHIHHVVRFEHDPVWPNPVWGNIAPKPYTAVQLKQTLKRLHKMLESGRLTFSAHDPNRQGASN